MQSYGGVREGRMEQDDAEDPADGRAREQLQEGVAPKRHRARHERMSSILFYEMRGL